MNVRRPAVAGAFYPADPLRLRAEVEAHLAAADAAGPPAPRALIAPHAGYVYSGAVAGSAFRQLEGCADRIERVVLLGPSHFVPFAGCAVPAAEAFSTPLGAIAIDLEAVAQLSRLPTVVVADRPHEREHSLEVELPFLQVVLGEFRLVPIVVGDASSEQVAALIERLWSTETLVVVSTDLSHYLDYEAAAQRDRATAAAIVALTEEHISDSDACGARPLRGLLRFARERRLTVRELDRRSSGDTAGPRERVVGYGAYALA